MTMKKFLLLFLISTLVVLTGSCGKSDEAGEASESQAGLTVDQVTAMLGKFNQQPLGLNIAAEPDQIKIKSADKAGRYIVTLEQPSLSFDIAEFGDSKLGEQLKNAKIEMQAGQMEFIYGPDEPYLELSAMRQFSALWSTSIKSEEKEGEDAGAEIPGTPQMMDLQMSCDSAIMQGYELTPVLDTESAGFIDLLQKLVPKSNSTSAEMDNFTYGLKFVMKDEKKVHVHLGIKQMKGSGIVEPSFIMAMYAKDPVTIDFPGLLASGKALLQIKADVSDLSFKVETETGEIANGSIGSGGFGYVLKPDADGKFFDFSMSSSLGAMAVSIPSKPEMEKFFNLEKWDMKFAFEHLSGELINTYLEMVRSQQQGANAADPQASGAALMKLMSALMTSNPAISISIPEFKHYFGALTADARFQMSGMMSPPTGKAVVKIANLNEFLEKIAAEKSISPEISQMLPTQLKALFITDDSGAATLTFEIKPEDAQNYYLNGNPIGLTNKK